MLIDWLMRNSAVWDCSDTLETCMWSFIKWFYLHSLNVVDYPMSFLLLHVWDLVGVVFVWTEGLGAGLDNLLSLMWPSHGGSGEGMFRGNSSGRWKFQYSIAGPFNCEEHKWHLLYPCTFLPPTEQCLVLVMGARVSLSVYTRLWTLELLTADLSIDV